MSQDKPQSLTEVTGVEYQRFLIKYARERLSADNFYDADFALQVCHSREANNAALFNLRALLAHGLGLYDHALSYVNRALELSPGWERATLNHALIQKALEQQGLKREKNNQQVFNTQSEEKFFLIHSWGSGFGFDLLYLLQQLLLAEMCNRTPVIHWGSNSKYNDSPEENCFTDFFKPITKLKIDDLKTFMPDVYPEFWQNRDLEDHIRRTRWKNRVNGQLYKIGGPLYLNRSERVVVGGEFATIKMLLPWMLDGFRYTDIAKTNTAIVDVYRDLIKRHLHPKKFLQTRANKFVKKAFPEGEYIALHLRGTDKHQEKQSNSIAEINEELVSRVGQMSNELPIFLMTDDSRQVTAMQERFGDRLKTIDVLRGSDDEKGIHLSHPNKKQMAEEVLVDMLVAAQSQHFLGCGFSYLACVVSYMREANQLSTLLPMDFMTRFVNIPVQK